MKQRVRKRYKHSSLDAQLRQERMIREASSIHEARLAGVNAPSILGMDLAKNSIVMTYVDGELARDGLEEMNHAEILTLLGKLGILVGRLHVAGIVHGDLTTSNVVVADDGVPFLLDFGMSHRSTEAEDRGVDLHLLQRSISISHPRYTPSQFKAVSLGYRRAVGEETSSATLRKAAEIARRGRYFAIR